MENLRISSLVDNFNKNSKNVLKQLDEVNIIIEAFVKQPNNVKLYTECILRLNLDENELNSIFESIDENDFILRSIYGVASSDLNSEAETIDNDETNNQNVQIASS